MVTLAAFVLTRSGHDAEMMTPDVRASSRRGRYRFCRIVEISSITAGPNGKGAGFHRRLFH